MTWKTPTLTRLSFPRCAPVASTITFARLRASLVASARSCGRRVGSFVYTYCGEFAESGIPAASTAELRSAVSVTAWTRAERTSKLRERRNDVTRPRRETVSVEIGWTVISSALIPSLVRNARILVVQPASSAAASVAEGCWLVTEKFQRT